MSAQRDVIIGRVIGKFIERATELFTYCIGAVMLRILFGAIAKIFALSTGGNLPVPSVDTLLLVIVGLVLYNNVINRPTT